MLGGRALGTLRRILVQVARRRLIGEAATVSSREAAHPLRARSARRVAHARGDSSDEGRVRGALDRRGRGAAADGAPDREGAGDVAPDGRNCSRAIGISAATMRLTSCHSRSGQTVSFTQIWFWRFGSPFPRAAWHFIHIPQGPIHACIGILNLVSCTIV